MSTYDEIDYINEITKQLAEIEETIDEMGQKVGLFNLNTKKVEKLGLDAHNIKTNLYSYVDVLNQIEERKYTIPQVTDTDTSIRMNNSILAMIRKYQKELLPKYQETVQNLLGNKKTIEKKVTEKRQAGEKVPSEEETKKTLEDAEKKLQEAVKGQTNIQKTFNSIRSFAEKAKPYVTTLVQVAKIALKFL